MNMKKMKDILRFEYEPICIYCAWGNKSVDGDESQSLF